MSKFEIRTGIVEAGNTDFGFPLSILAARGFTVLAPPNMDESIQDYWAIHPTEKVRMIASSPLKLLGLLAIVDHLGPDWYTDPSVDLSAYRGVCETIDLDPEIIEEMSEPEVDRARNAFRLLCDVEGRDLDLGTSRSDLIAASRRYIVIEEKEERDAQL